MSGKAEARALRKLKKAADDAEKSARLRAPPSEAEVRSEYAKERPPAVRTGADPGSIYQLRVTWTLDHADRKGSWSWGPRDWSEETWETEIKPKLEDFEKLTWAEINSAWTGTGEKRRRMHHDMPTTEIVEEAQYRLVEINQYDETVFRFRLGGTERLWGRRVVGTFRIIWYDPEHNIYPVD